MMVASTHGVAHIRVAVGPLNPQEFYGVFFNGALQPAQYDSWADADAQFRRMQTFAINRRERADERVSA